MTRWVYSHTIVDGPAAQLDQLLRARLHDVLPRVEAEGPPDVDGSLLIQLEAVVAGHTTTKTARVRTGVADRIGDRTRIAVSWQAEPSRYAFPAFDGMLELEPLSGHHAQLTLLGAYRAPLGPLGAAADAAGLQTVAERTIKGLVEHIGQRLEALATDETRPAGVVSGAATYSGMRVRDVMSPDPLVFDEDLTLRTAAFVLVHCKVQGAPVVSSNGALVGVLSEHDLLEKESTFRPAFGRGGRDAERRRRAVTVGEGCTRPAHVTVPDASLREAARVMLDERVARLVVVDGAAIVGVITRHDVIKALLRSDAEIQAAVDAALEPFGEPDVEATVRWGMVHLSGTASLRSRIPHMVQAIRHVDGVMSVNGEPLWHQDDVVAALSSMHAP